MERPSTGRGTRATRPAGQDERASLGERAAVTSARLPPAGARIDHGIPARARMVRVDKLLNPRHHLGGALAVALRAVRVRLDVQHARKRDAVLAPPAAVGDEVVDLRRRTAAVRQREVVAATDEAIVGRADVVAVEALVDKASALGGLWQVCLLVGISLECTLVEAP